MKVEQILDTITYAVLPFQEIPGEDIDTKDVYDAFDRSYEVNSYEAAVEIANFLISTGGCVFCEIDLLMYAPTDIPGLEGQLIDEIPIGTIKAIETESEVEE